jgi:quinoprotein glucose dehydrogenase
MRAKLLGLGLVAAFAIAGWTLGGRAAGKDSKNHDWPAYSGDKASTKYSPLDQINNDTVKNVRIAWRQSAVPAELKAMFPDAQGPTNWQNTPIMVDGLLYMSSGVGVIVALDAVSGKVVWFDSPPHEEGKPPARAGMGPTRASSRCRART